MRICETDSRPGRSRLIGERKTSDGRVIYRRCGMEAIYPWCVGTERNGQRSSSTDPLQASPHTIKDKRTTLEFSDWIEGKQQFVASHRNKQQSQSLLHKCHGYNKPSRTAYDWVDDDISSTRQRTNLTRDPHSGPYNMKGTYIDESRKRSIA